LDPEDADREEFLRWVVRPVMAAPLNTEQLQQLSQATKGYSAAAFASLRSELKAKAVAGKLAFDRILELVGDNIPPAIEDTRRYQALQALVNCTRRSLLPGGNVTEEQRRQWEQELRMLEAKGTR
jgi:hypothetical protein